MSEWINSLALWHTASIAETNGLGISTTSCNDLLDTSVKSFALLLYSTEAKGDRGKGDRGDNGGRDLNHPISKHRLLLASAGFLGLRVLAGSELLSHVEV